MSLHNDIKTYYRDCIGQVHIRPRGTNACNQDISQNGQLFLAQTHLLLSLKEELQGDVFQEERANYYAGMEACRIYNTAISRHNETHVEEFQSPDNMIGFCASSYAFNDKYYPTTVLKYMEQTSDLYKLSDLLNEILDQSKWYNRALTTIGKYIGLSHVYKFHESQSLKQTWLGRQLGLIALLKLCAGRRPTYLESFVFIIAQIISANSKGFFNVDPANLGWMASHATKNKGFIYKLTHKYFIYKMKKKYKDVNFGEVYWPSNPSHPNAKHFQWE